MKVNEIFYDIQGESSLVGLPTVFIRLSGCNLKCQWCDTDHVFKMDVTIDDILNVVRVWDCKQVCITGGEPLLQDIKPLEDILIGKGYKTCIFTNGTKGLGHLKSKIIMDVKCPGSGNTVSHQWGDLKTGDEIKCVISDRADYDYAVNKIIEEMETPENSFDSDLMVHFSPVFGVLNPSRLAEWIMRDGLEVRLHLQQHKMIKIMDGKGYFAPTRYGGGGKVVMWDEL